MTELIPLGVNGFFPFNGRQTACYLIIKDDTVIVLDAGTGISGLLTEKIKEKIKGKEINIILSHYHLDHTCGLSYLTGLKLGRKVKVYCPLYPLVKAKNINGLKKVLSPPIFSLKFIDLPMEAKEISSESFKIGKINVKLLSQYHPGGSVGVKIDNEIVYITDTVVSDKTAKFAKNAKLLLHELWITDKELKEAPLEADGKRQDEKHSYESGVVKIALESKCEKVMPIHMTPWRTEKEIKELVDRMNKKGVDALLPKEFKSVYAGK